MLAGAASPAGEPADHAQQRVRDDDSAVLLLGNLLQRVEPLELQGNGIALHLAGRLREDLRGVALRAGGDDLGLALPAALGDGGHGTPHALGDLHVLHLNGEHLDAPLVRVHVDDLSDALVDRRPGRQHVVKGVLAQHRSERHLRKLADGHGVIVHLEGRLACVHDAVIADGIDPDAKVVARHHVLRGDVQAYRLQRQRDDLLRHDVVRVTPGR
mmetsp:Transcript_77687/g.240729  ORF Transcript_77687/g.240729 Transcript_77687/m.240729 type:complete len:214 (-) Transcript_77687:307-948(-)